MNADNFSSLITRVEDLPYYTSPPVQFSFTQQASLVAGTYPFTAARATVTGDKNLTDNTMYFIKAISFSADVRILDYQQAIQLAAGTTDVPRFYMFLQSDSNSPVLADPIILQDYFSDQEFKQLVEPKNSPNRLSAFFRGTLQQHAGLAGVSQINLTMQVWVQFIDDDNFIAGLKKNYPRTVRY